MEEWRVAGLQGGMKEGKNRSLASCNTGPARRRLVSILLFFAAAIGGGLNAVAGGGSFLTLPALIVAGVSPVVANATSTLALWPASLSSTFAYRRELRSSGRWLIALGLTSVLGGLAGALLLV